MQCIPESHQLPGSEPWARDICHLLGKACEENSVCRRRICPSTYPADTVSRHFTYLSIRFIGLSIERSIYPSIYLLTCLPILSVLRMLSTYLPVYVSTDLSMHLPDKIACRACTCTHANLCSTPLLILVGRARIAVRTHGFSTKPKQVHLRALTLRSWILLESTRRHPRRTT